ncbi:hypothetical protein MMC07_009353 [Pseudocyphellaria aurata]|nr:hypothetical protein [Pseudocyphellaria aurata]
MQNNDGRPSLSSPGISYREQPSSVYHPTTSPHPAANSTYPRPNIAPLIPPLSIPSMPVRSPMPNRMTEQQRPRSDSGTPLGTQMRSPQLYHAVATPEYSPMPPLNRSTSHERYYTDAITGTFETSKIEQHVDIQSYDPNQRHASFGSYGSGRAQKSPNPDPRLSRSSTGTFTSPAKYHPSPASAMPVPSPQRQTSQAHIQNGGDNESYTPHQTFPPLLPLPPPGFQTVPHSATRAAQVSYAGTSTPLTPVDTASSLDLSGSGGMDSQLLEQAGTLYSMPVFGGNGYGQSPNVMPEDFTVWLFGAPQLNNAPPVDPRNGSVSLGITAFMDDSGNFPHMPYGVDDGPLNGHYVQPIPLHRMAVENLLEPPLPSTILSEDKRMQLLGLIRKRFEETDHAPVSKQKEDLLRGDLDSEGHVLSLQMMKTYIGSYWYHFHPQLPILHQPTFSADGATNLLLIAVITVGASCLDKRHGATIIKAGQELSNFLAWHLRIEIFKDKDFTPPAKLWVFQALLLLEIYEKMYSTRVLHERAHIHHVTTLTLMRRGSSLIGGSNLDSPPTIKEGGVSRTGQQASSTSTPEQWWNHWIINEATRRVAFAAFIIDSIHATMFGHSATMVAHEMKLQLPCDETAWSATSSAEVNRIETSLRANGIKPISFFEGLKLTLNNKTVRTNAFGRTALMAGLLSVSWHMNQRDVQVRSLGALKALGGKDIWRGTLTKAFDSWRNDFDQSIGKDGNTLSPLFQPQGKFEEENFIFESRTVLHPLAHMAMHVDIVSCQIFAKASRLLGRTTLPADYAIAQKRIREHWAPKASARHATFYALKFLAQLLIPDAGISQRSPGAGGMTDGPEYSAKDDSLLNRPWVLYFAALTVWSYGYSLDGPVRSVPELLTYEQQAYDMRQYLRRVGGVKSPGDLEHMRDRNACMGMLYILREMFDKCRWELVHEAAQLLSNCIDMLRGIS